MGKGYKTGLLVITFFIIVIFGAYVYSRFHIKKTKKSGFSVVVDKISKYNYTLDERDSKLMREKFKDLKKVLKEKEINYSEYASLLAQMYIIDLYDLNNKVNKYDVPCLEYILDKEHDKFKKMIKNDFYSQLKDNSNGDRKQDLPTIKSIKVTDVGETTYDTGDVIYSGYLVKLEWEYDKELGFDKKSEIIVAKVDNQLYVIKQTPIID